MALSAVQFYLVLWTFSGQKVKWLLPQKNRNYPLNPLQDSFKAAIISFNPTPKYFYSSLRRVDADWVWRHYVSAEEDLWGDNSASQRVSFFPTWLRQMGPEYYCGTWACDDADPLRMWTRPAPFTPKSSILPFEPIPWHICTLKPCYNLPGAVLDNSDV